MADGVRDVVGQRLVHLSPSTRAVLHAAAVVGPAFDVDVVAAAGGIDDDVVVPRWTRRQRPASCTMTSSGSTVTSSRTP